MRERERTVPHKGGWKKSYCGLTVRLFLFCTCFYCTSAHKSSGLNCSNWDYGQRKSTNQLASLIISAVLNCCIWDYGQRKSTNQLASLIKSAVLPRPLSPPPFHSKICLCLVQIPSSFWYKRAITKAQSARTYYKPPFVFSTNIMFWYVPLLWMAGGSKFL